MTLFNMADNTKEISDKEIEEFSSSVLGQLKLKIFELATNQKKIFPEESALRKFILSVFRENANLGQLLFDVNYFQDFLFLTQYQDLNFPNNIFKVFAELYENPLPARIFLEVRECDRFPSAQVLLLFRRIKLINDVHLYEIHLLDAVSFPDSLIGKVSLFLEASIEESTLKSITFKGVEDVDISSGSFDLLVELALNGLSYLNSNRARKQIDFTEILNQKLHDDDNNVLRPPEDKRLSSLLQQATWHNIPCHHAIVPIERIRPFDLKFCVDFPATQIDWAIEDIENGRETRMLVYWNGSYFVMSDDYSSYLGYRKIAASEVPVTILGNELPKDVKIDRTGGCDLIPPIIVSSFPISREPEYTDRDLERKLLGKKSSPEIAHLSALYIVLCKHLQDPNPLERKIHDFLCQNPIILDPSIKEIKTELCLANDYRVDIAATYQFDDKRILLIELERVDAKLFKRSGDLSAEAYHAYEQVENWLFWWKSNPDKLPIGFDNAVIPHGLVVIGRNSDLDDSRRKKLVSLNSNRQVRLITYDTLLDQLENLINVLEGNANLPSSRTQKRTARGFQKQKNNRRKP